jgi:hypothetical protein
MKTLMMILSIFTVSLFCAPHTEAAKLSAKEMGLMRGNPFVKQSSVKRFKSASKNKRRRHTCMKKKGCTGKSVGLFDKKRPCPAYHN